MDKIESDKLYQAFIIGAQEVMENRLFLNKINFFPVADGDTGNNLYHLMQSILIKSELKTSSMGTLKSIAESAIIGARGTSGAIFAQYIQGLSLLDLSEDQLTKENFIEVSRQGANFAYLAVENPIEGTIITAMGLFSDFLTNNNNQGVTFSRMVEKSYEDIEKLNLSDAGARGFIFFINGFVRGLKGEAIIKVPVDTLLEEAVIFENNFNSLDQLPKFRYCTEALVVNKDKKKIDLKEVFSDLGDSLILASNRKYTRLHIHTNQPDKIFKELSRSYKILEQKVEDMHGQYNMLHNRKFSTLILTDSIADVPKRFLDLGQVVVLPLDILIGSERYIDGLTINNDLLFDLELTRGIRPTTSQASLFFIRKKFQDLLVFYEDILVISVSSKMSGTYQTMILAAQKFDGRVQVIDSKRNSVAQGLIVVKAIEFLTKGGDAKTIKRQLEPYLKKSEILVSVRDIKSMVESGRLKGKSRKIVEFLNLYPIISINKKGMAYVKKIIMGPKRIQSQLIGSVKKVMNKDGIESFALAYVDNEAAAKLFAEELESVINLECLYVVQTSSIIALGAGKGAFAIGFIRK